MPYSSLDELNRAIIRCVRCPRLVEYRRRVAKEKRRAFQDQTYWGKPVPGWGDPGARVQIVGLAPAAHGGNRTGRVFTGDRSGDFLYAALYRAGFASQPASVARDDGLVLSGVYVGAAVRCAPPDNKPLPTEFANCHPYLQAEFRLLPNVRVLLALGKIAFDTVLALLAENAVALPRPRPVFGHNRSYRLGPYSVVASYHPSQRNTSTGLLTPAMFDAVLATVREELDRGG